jgi:Dolichyl-phosphate-mannose-protein mannosyltransferase
MTQDASTRPGDPPGGAAEAPGPEPAGTGRPAPAEPAEPAPAGPLSRLRDSARLAAPAIGLYLVLRLVSLEVMAVLANTALPRSAGRQVYWDGSHAMWRGWTSPVDPLLSWDARWYILLAGSGTGGPLGAVDANGVPYEMRLMFFPLYPALARPLTFLPFVSPAAACLIVSLAAAVAAAWGIFAIGRKLHGNRFGIMLVALWAVVPAALTQNGAFTESLFTAIAAWALLAVLNERWLTAGLLAGLSGLSRPTAAALIAAVGLAALVAAVQRRGGWRPYAAMLLAPAGLIGYLAYASARLGGLDRYFEIHRETFGAHFDYGVSTWNVVKGIVIGVGDDAAQPIRVLSVVFLFGFLLLLVLAAVNRTPWPLLVFAVATLVLAVGSRAHISMIGRHLLPVFPVLLVPAAVLARAAPRNAALVLGTLALTSGWYAGWLPFISGQAI